MVAGITGVTAYYLLENVALLFSTATAVGVIVAASPLFTALFSAAMGDRSALSARFALALPWPWVAWWSWVRAAVARRLPPA